MSAILFLSDQNGDGDANDPGEIAPFYDDSAPGISLSIPNGLALGPGGAIFVTDDGAAVRSVIRLVDANNDGDANDDGESLVFYDDTALSPPNLITDPESIAVTPRGVVYVGDSTLSAVFRLEDLNGDGDALDAGEATVFYEGNQPVELFDIDSLQLDASEGLYAVDEDTGSTLYLRDENADGDALDSGEAQLFLDGEAPGAIVSDPNDALFLDGRLLFVDGSLDAIVSAEDLNGDGVAEGPGEVTLIFDDGGNLLSAPSGIAHRAGPQPFPPAPRRRVRLAYASARALRLRRNRYPPYPSAVTPPPSTT